jgi:hypothetical protein
VSAKAKVVNAVWNGSYEVRRKTANHFVAEGRAVWVGRDQLRLLLTHPKNQAAAARAAKGYQAAWFEKDGRRPGTVTATGRRENKRHNDHVCLTWPQPRVNTAPPLFRSWTRTSTDTLAPCDSWSEGSLTDPKIDVGFARY